MDTKSNSQPVAGGGFLRGDSGAPRGSAGLSRKSGSERQVGGSGQRQTPRGNRTKNQRRGEAGQKGDALVSRTNMPVFAIRSVRRRARPSSRG